MPRSMTHRIVFMLFILCAGCNAHANPPHATVGSEAYPNADAVILKWEQHWTLLPDGAVEYRDHRWVRLLDARAIRRYADPRIDVDTAHEELAIDVCRTWLPDMDVLPVPSYGINTAAPSDFNGWPRWAAWEQRIVSFSGIEMGCILELAYTRKTRAGVYPWIEADLCLNLDDPTVERVVSLTVPAGTEVLHRVDQARTDSDGPVVATEHDGQTTYTWLFNGLDAAPAEPQSLPWQQRCGRLRFTTCSGIVGLTTGVLQVVNDAAEPTSTITNFALETIGEEQNTLRCVRLLADRLHASFNLVDDPRAWRDLQCLAADEVFERNYGNTLEATALLAALCRSIGLPATIHAVGHGLHFDPAIPTLASLDGLAVRIDQGDDAIFARADGAVFRNTNVPHTMVLLRLGAEQLERETLEARHDMYRNRIHVDGRLTFSADGVVAGSFTVTLGGVFFDPMNLDTADAQERLLQATLSRLIPGAILQSYTVSQLSDGVLVARIEARADDAVSSLETLRALDLGAQPLFLSTIPVDLDRSLRQTDVDMRCAFHEMIDLTVTVPDAWEIAIAPARIDTAAGTWGEVLQLVAAESSTLQMHREINVRKNRLSPANLAELRPALNMMRSEAARTMVFQPHAE
jgi:hypothetical protein